MGAVLILPFGVTLETVEGLLRADFMSGVEVILAVGVRGYPEDEVFREAKERVVLLIKDLGAFMGAGVRVIWGSMGDYGLPARVFEELRSVGPDAVIVSGVTGSRFVLPPIIMAVLHYCGRAGCRPYLIHGIEGDGWRLVPLRGFFPQRLPRSALRLFVEIYSRRGEVFNPREILRELGLPQSSYRSFHVLDEAGLIEWVGKGRARKTVPGRMLFELIKVMGVE